MKILTISPTYPPRTGGLETYVAALSGELARLGHEVSVLTNRDDSTQSARTTDRGVTILRTSSLLDGNGHANYVPWERAYFSLLTDVAELLDSAEFDVVHCHTQAGLLLAHLSGLAARTPTAASFHETNPLRDPLGHERTSFILRACTAQAYLVGSHVFAKQAKALGIAESKIQVVRMGVGVREHTSRFSARQHLQSAFGIDPAKVMITLIGRLTPRKEHRRLLTAYDQMCHRDDAVVVLAGSDNSTDERYVHQLRQDVASLARNGIHMLENVSDAHRDLLIDGSDIGTQPSRTEGLGLATIEFMMAGVPVLVSDVPGLQEAVGGYQAALVETTDPSAYAAALDQLTADTELRERRGASTVHSAHTHFSIMRAATQTLEAYSRICQAAV